MKDRKEFEELLQLKFNELQDKVVPKKELEKEIFKTIERLHSLSDIMDLFVIKFPKSIADFIINENKHTQNKPIK